MKQKNIMHHAFFILIITIAFVIAYPLLHSKLSFLNQNFKRYDLFEGFLLKNSVVVNDSIFCEDDSMAISLINVDTIIIPKYAGTQFLHSFFKQLKRKNTQTRIAYYGDSVIEGDLVTQTLRDSLQKRFGGKGVGFIPMISRIAGFRRSINQHFSGNWTVFNVLKTPPATLSLGYLGETFCCANTFFYKKDSIENSSINKKEVLADSTITDSLLVLNDSLPVAQLPDTTTLPLVENEAAVDSETAKPMATTFIASRRFAGVTTLAQAHLYYKKSNNAAQTGSVQVKIGETEKIYLLDGQQAVNRLPLNSTFIRKVNLKFDQLCSHQLYGMSFESPTGVIVDNIPSRGNSGRGLMRLQPQLMQQFQATLGVDLVILQFGMNVLNAKMTDYSWYTTEMNRVLKNAKAGFPKATILLIGPPDRSVKLDGKMQTDPSVKLITAVLREVAAKNETAFFSFYEAMGGEGSMVKWVEESEPALANLDYTHFNFKGAEKAGGFLLNFLLEAYEEWLINGEKTD